MIIYHGSENIIKQPIFGYGKKYNDYGLGFYTTKEANMAKEWAVSIDRDGYCNKYVLDEKDLSILDLNSSEYSILNWLSILLENRIFDIFTLLALEAKEYLLGNFLPQYKDKDLIIGYRADDSYFSFASDFINGSITLKQLSIAMKLGKSGCQVVLKSEKAFQKIDFVDSQKVKKDVWYNKKIIRDSQARSDYFNLKKNKREKGDLFITDIIDKGIKNNDLLIQ